MRSGYLDALRGIAVVWMIIFHAAYDLTMFNFLGLNFNQGFWFGFPRLIAGTFLFCVGLSLNYTHRGSINRKALGERTLKLGLCALAISVATYIGFREQWIYFGTLHCILAGSLLGALFVNHRQAAWIVMIVILIAQYALGYDINWVSSIIQKHSMDFIPIYPWLWVILAGIILGPYLDKSDTVRKIRSPRFLSFLGRHSLKIYLLHQPILFGIIALIARLR
jgi:uncharacterized membrane protein